MPALSDWLPLAVIGVSFTLLGVLKVVGRCRGIIGGGGKPFGTRICGSCPTWSSPMNTGMVVLFFAIGLTSLGMVAFDLLRAR